MQEPTLKLVMKMHKPADLLPVPGREVIVITTDNRALFAVRQTDVYWQDLSCTDSVHPTYGKFETRQVYAWGFLGSREWRIENVSEI